MSKRERAFHTAMVLMWLGFTMMALNGDTRAGARWGALGLINAGFLVVQLIVCQHLAWKDLHAMARQHASADATLPLTGVTSTAIMVVPVLASITVLTLFYPLPTLWLLALVPVTLGASWAVTVGLWVHHARRLAPLLPEPAQRVSFIAPVLAIGGMALGPLLAPGAPDLALGAVVISCAAWTEMVGLWLGWAERAPRLPALQRFAAVFGWREDQVVWRLAGLTILVLTLASIVSTAMATAGAGHGRSVGLLTILFAVFDDPSRLWRPPAWYATVIGLPLVVLAWQGTPKWRVLIVPLAVAHFLWNFIAPFPELSTWEGMARLAAALLWSAVYWPAVWGTFAVLLRTFQSPAAAWVIGFGGMNLVLSPFLDYGYSGFLFLVGAWDTAPSLHLDVSFVAAPVAQVASAVIAAVALSALHRAASTALTAPRVGQLGPPGAKRTV